MNVERVSDLRSPVTGRDLVLEIFAAAGDEVVAGRLIEPDSGDWYRIEEGIADLAPPEYRSIERHAAFCAQHRLEPGSPSPGRYRPDDNALSQISFFAKYHDLYEHDVVASPFYKILYEVTFGRWARRCLAPGATVAEIGCGSGQQTLPMLRQGVDIVAFDLSEDMLRVAREKVLAAAPPGRVDFIRGLAEHLPLRAGICDAAVICGSLHHFSDPPAALREAGRIMRSGGRLFLLEPHNSPLRFIFDWLMRIWTLWEEEANDEPLFDAHQFRAWLAAAGIESTIGYSTYLPPHLFYQLGSRSGEALLGGSDRLFSAIPGVRRFAGVIMAEGTKLAAPI